MTWFKVDDSFFAHPKVAELEAGPCFAQALALWTVAGSWCAHHLTDGRVPAAALRKLVPFPATRAASELVRVGLWTQDDDGYHFRDWVHYQPTKEEVEAGREGSANRSRKYRQRAKERHDVTGSVTRDGPPETASDEARDVTASVTPQNVTRDAAPSRPVPSSLRSDTSAPDGGGQPAGPDLPAKCFGTMRLFARRYEQARQILWPGSGKHGTAKLEAWIRGQAELDGRPPEAVAEQLVAGFFADEWAASKGFPWGALVTDPGRYYRPPSPAPDGEHLEIVA